tara:strand:+ start:492 stop:701 length:210 start_codon:yes stop_codon:yes gene_type:complete
MIKLTLEGVLTIVVSIVLALIFGGFICFLWPIITFAIPGLEGLVASELSYIDATGLSLLIGVLVGSARN